MQGIRMIITNLDHIPEREASRTMGLVIGYASSGSDDKEGDELFTILFERAKTMLHKQAKDLHADAVLKVDGKITRDDDGIPEILLVGTAVKLQDGVEGSPNEKEEETPTMRPSNPTTEIVRMIRQREKSDRLKEKKRKDIYDLADEIGISFDKAELLMENGFGTLESISDSASKELSGINGINPTQARILIKKARELLDQERGL